MPKNKPEPGAQPGRASGAQPGRPSGRRPGPKPDPFSGPAISSLLARSDLPGAAKFAVAGATTLAIPAIIAVVVALVGAWLEWPLLQWTAIAVLLAWFLCASVAGGVIAGPRSFVGAFAAGVVGVWAWLSGAPFFGGSLLVIAAGLAVGAFVRWQWDRTQERREARLAALPNWERDELGDVADRLDPEFGRKPGPPIIGDYAGPAVRLLAAVCRPLHGSTVLAGSPAVAVNGSRVAVLLTGVELADAGSVPPLPRLPAGARARVFVLREGTELDAAVLSDAATSGAPEPSGDREPSGAPEPSDDPATRGDRAELPALRGTGRGGVTEVVASEPQELAAYLGAGTPPDGDATDGIAADLHSRVLRALDGYAGQGERQQRN